MKKLLSLLLAGTMLFSLAACGDESEEKDSNKKNKFDAVEDGGFVDNESKNVQIGDYITFGKYEQDNDTANGKEDIEWLVLDKEGSRVLVISKYALDCKPYNEEKADVTWETCTLRSWLNDEFFNVAFTNSEKTQIPAVAIAINEYSNNINYTQDKIFLFSLNENYDYFDSEDARKCQATNYAIAQGTDISDSIDNEGNCYWWLRSNGNTAAGVNMGGFAYGNYAKDADGIGVRPTMWIEL